MIVEGAELYRCRTMEGLRVPLMVRQVDIEDVIPTEVEFAAEVKGLKGGRLGDSSGMCAEYLKV